MQKAESVQDCETHKIPRDFETQMDHLITTRRRNLEIIKKMKKGVVCRIVGFAGSLLHYNLMLNDHYFTFYKGVSLFNLI